MDTEKKVEEKKTGKKRKRKNLRIPPHIIDELEKIAEKHYRTFNGELIVALEAYINDWRNKH